jgi:hypothetical protein
MGPCALLYRARKEIEAHANTQVHDWAMQSNATFDQEKRLQVATQLMGSLGGEL